MAFIRETEGWYPAETAQFSVEEQRRVYDRMCRAFASERPDGVTCQDRTIASNSHSIPVRTYKSLVKSKAKLIYFHGGGFVVGGLESHDDVCAEICAQTGFDVISVDYRLSPEHPFPADFEDAKTAFDEINDSTELPVVLAGDSAGACLAAAVVHESRYTVKPPVGQVLIYPGLGGDSDHKSYVEHAKAPMLTTQDVHYYQKVRSGGEAASLKDPRCAPLASDSFADLPPTYIVSAECDPLAGDSESYYMALKAAGGDVVWVNEMGLVHGYLRARHRSEKAKSSFARIIAAIRLIGVSGQLPQV